jgi:hypothetical protein
VIEASMTWQGNTKPLTFFRPVTLIGETHPSVLRLRGRGMRPSHFAAVIADQALWMVNVSPEEMPPNERVRCLRKAGDETQIGNVTVRFVSATVKTTDFHNEWNTTKVPSHPLQTRGNDRQVILDPPEPDRAVYRTKAAHANAKPPASSEQTVHEMQSQRKREEPAKPDRKPKPESKRPGEAASSDEHSPTSYANTQAMQLMSVQRVLVASHTPLVEAPVPESASQPSETDAGDELASETTDRMVSKEKWKKISFFYLVKLAALMILFSVAGLLWSLLMVKIIRDWF